MKKNSATGEVVTTNKRFKIKVEQDSFYMTYIESISGIFKLTSAVDIKILIKLCTLATFDTGDVQLSPHIRLEILKSVGLSTQQLTNSLNNLKKKHLITGIRGDYKLNPLVFWKGSNETRNNMLKGDGKLKLELEFGYKIEKEIDNDTNLQITMFEQQINNKE